MASCNGSISVNKFFSWISSIFVGFFKSSRSFVSLCIKKKQAFRLYGEIRRMRRWNGAHRWKPKRTEDNLRHCHYDIRPYTDWPRIETLTTTYSTWGVLLAKPHTQFLSNNPSGRNVSLKLTQPRTEMIKSGKVFPLQARLWPGGWVEL